MGTGRGQKEGEVVKWFRLFMVGLSTIVMLSLVSAPASAGCSSSNAGVLGWWPIIWDDVTCGCSYGGLVTKLIDGAANMGGYGHAYFDEYL